MSEKERIRMSEIDHYDSDTDKDTINIKNHFLLHTTDGLTVVVYENWIEIEQDEWQNTDKRRISEKKKNCIKKLI